MSYKVGFVGLVGLPNAGKSSIANLIVGEKFTIVCKKAQTTRRRILGIYDDEDSQFIITDAPGVIEATRGLNSFLQEEYKDVVGKSDVLLACLNLDANNEDTLDNIVEICSKAGKPWAIVITKSDLLNKMHRMFHIREKYKDLNIPIIQVSCLSEVNKNREVLIDLLKSISHSSPQKLYSDDIYTTESMRDMASEVIREKCFEYLHDELPYGLAVQVRKYEEGEKLHKIYADIILDKESYKPIVLGKSGVHIKKIGMDARKDLENLLGNKVYLDLHVSVKEKWMRNKQLLKELGYVVKND